ncbi:DUF305 domain-containing protein [Actinokineospora enzanensis]|uniref:DUF305 domain-containing protein n=1 Tax=Actinokineospora enzanensis TaxID=155975 RepID=UPI00036E464E|nr:DUF305 domain-containing protein [Actinokineospora enzanensis]
MAGLIARGGVSMIAVLLAVSACTDDTEPAVGMPTNPVVQPGKPGGDNRTLSPAEISAGARVDQPNSADFMYAEMMIQHHQQAVDMTALAATHAQDAAVKGLADRIAHTQQPEIDAMNAWLAGKGRPKIDPSHGQHAGHQMPMPGMATPEQMVELQGAYGPGFDRQFLQLMTRHHEGAIQMAKDIQQHGVDVRVQEMADDIVAEQSDEIQRMRTMLGG